MKKSKESKKPHTLSLKITTHQKQLLKKLQNLRNYRRGRIAREALEIGIKRLEKEWARKIKKAIN